MKLFRKSVVIFLVFMLGTMALIHVDRQCAQMEKTTADIAEEVENIIEKQGCCYRMDIESVRINAYGN